MSFEYTFELITFILVLFNYIVVLYYKKWNFADYASVGWFMALLGWLKVIT
jgi:hypothetical protein